MRLWNTTCDLFLPLNLQILAIQMQDDGERGAVSFGQLEGAFVAGVCGIKVDGTFGKIFLLGLVIFLNVQAAIFHGDGENGFGAEHVFSDQPVQLRTS